MFAYGKAGNTVVAVGNQIGARRKFGHTQTLAVCGGVERIAALMRHGFYIGNALRMQLQGQRQRFGRRLAGVVVGRGADAAGDESGQAV